LNFKWAKLREFCRNVSMFFDQRSYLKVQMDQKAILYQ